MTGSAILGIFVNWLFVPQYGGIGAAVATVITYFLWISASMAVSQSLWKINYSFKLVCLQLFCTVIFMSWIIFNESLIHTFHPYVIGLLLILSFLFLAIGPENKAPIKSIF